MRDIYRYGLLPTAGKQLSPDSTIRKLQENNDAKYIWKVTLNCKANRRIEKIDWSSMSPDLAPFENLWQLVKMKLRKKN